MFLKGIQVLILTLEVFYETIGFLGRFASSILTSFYENFLVLECKTMIKKAEFFVDFHNFTKI